jgi:hypothetical protein
LDLMPVDILHKSQFLPLHTKFADSTAWDNRIA